QQKQPGQGREQRDPLTRSQPASAGPEEQAGCEDRKQENRLLRRPEPDANQEHPGPACSPRSRSVRALSAWDDKPTPESKELRHDQEVKESIEARPTAPDDRVREERQRGGRHQRRDQTEQTPAEMVNERQRHCADEDVRCSRGPFAFAQQRDEDGLQPNRKETTGIENTRRKP